MATVPRLELLEARTLLAGVTLTQLTDTPNAAFSTNAAFSGDGARVAFQSTANLVGSNRGANLEILLFDTITHSLSAVTNTVSGDSSDVAINSDGTRLAFQSTAELTGHNSDGNTEIFLVDTTTGGLIQVTDTANATSSGAAINGDGTMIAFESSADLTGDNADGNFEIFLFDTVTGGFTQVTETLAGDNFRATVSADGTKIAFDSTADLTGDNADGTSEIFVFDIATGTFAQVTSATVGESMRPSLSSDGSSLAIDSTADLTGDNADGNREIFWLDTTSGLMQVTHTSSDEYYEYENSHPSMSGDGSRIAFQGTAIEYNDRERLRIFIYDTTNNQLDQVTESYDAPTFDSRPVISTYGTRIAYEHHDEPSNSTAIVLYGLVDGESASLTNGISGTNSNAAISSDGTRVAFDSNASFDGNNVDGNREIVQVDTTTGDFKYITDTTSRPLSTYSDHGVINDVGNLIAFDSNANPTGHNADGNREIFLFETTTSTLTQVTDTTGGASSEPAINGSGTRIAFESTANPLGTNADGNREIFFFDAVAGILTQVTDTSGASTFSLGASLSDDGNTIAFDSTADLTGENADRNREIFLFNVLTGTFAQVTDAIGGASSGASISGDGTKVAFDSYGDLAGSNVDRNREIFLFDVISGAFTQVTDTTSGASSDASITGDGMKVAFSSRGNLTGSNADGTHEIFLFDSTSSSITQVTDSTDLSNLPRDSRFPSVNRDGTRIAFHSVGDFGTLAVYLFDSTTSSITPISDETAGAGVQPSLSSDGESVAFTFGGFFDEFGGLFDEGSAIVSFDAGSNSSFRVTTAPAPVTNSRNASVSGDGNRLAFQSTGDPTGQNPDHNEEIFFVDNATGNITQVTDTTGSLHTTNNGPASISGDGNTIAFSSRANLTGDNADANDEIFVYDVATAGLIQVTSSTGGASSSVSVSGDGSSLAFLSSANLTGMNADGNDEIFVFDTTTSSFTQVTNTIGPRSNRSPSISGDGNTIAFGSSANLTGNNSDGNRELFLCDVTTSSFTQVTDTTGISDSGNTSVNSDGTRIAFSSRADLTGNNADEFFEVFLFDAIASRVTQVTTTLRVVPIRNIEPSINGDGTEIVFAYGNEILLAIIGQTGDYNGDGIVDQADLDLVTMNWGKLAVPAPNGWVNDLPRGIVDQAELDSVLINWGATSPPTEQATEQAVPESQPVSVTATKAVAPALARARAAKLKMDGFEPVLAARDHVFHELARHRGGFRSSLTAVGTP